MYSLVQGLLRRRWEVEVIELIGLAPAQSSFENEFKKAGVKIRRATDNRSFANYNIPAALAPFASLFPGNLPVLVGQASGARRFRAH